MRNPLNSRPLVNYKTLCPALIIVFGLAVRVFAGDSPQTILVLDASGSMWGKVDGRPKIEIAREVIRELVNELDPGIDLGLIAYSHRAKDDCDDIELLIPPGPLNKAEFLAAVQRIEPKGMTPLTDAVVKAAEYLKYTEQKAAVILVSDGVETCKKDPCTIAKQLEAKGVDFTAHVIGFDLSSKDLLSIECLARETGGQFLGASDAGTLKSALKTAVREVTAATTPEPPKATTGTLKVKTLASEGGREVSDVFYTLAAADGKTRSTGSNEIALEPGSYNITAQWGRANAQATAEIKAGETTETVIILGAGTLRVSAFASEGGERVEAFYEVLEYDASLDGRRETVTSGGGEQYKLPAGKYLLRAKWGPAASVEREITIDANKETEVRMILEAGVLKVEALAGEGGEAVDGFFTVYSPKKTLDGRREIVSSSGNGDFKLVAGKYVVEAKWGPAVAEEREVEVKAGESATVSIVLNAGVAVINGIGADGKSVTPFVDIVSAKKDLSGNRKLILSGSREFKLPAGSYVARAKEGTLTGEASFEVKAGERAEVSVSLK